MSSSVATTHPALAVAVARRAEAEAAERDVMVAAVAYAHAHPATGVTEDDVLYGDRSLDLAGPGAPGVSEFAVAEFAAALGMSTDAGRTFLGQALEVAHRLPQLWARVERGDVVAWRARRIADATTSLSEAAALYVDTHIAPIADAVGATRLMRLVDAARLLSEEPEMEVAVDADATRGVQIRIREAATTGVAYLDASLDVADALDLEKAVQIAAACLKEDGNDLPLDLRRSVALGEIARTYLAQQTRGDGSQSGVQLYVHYRPGSDGARNGFADLENTGGAITTDQLIRWCTRAGTKVTVTPVIDLNEPMTSTGYAPSHRLREQVILRDATCVFPHCHRRARGADLDHISPWDSGGATTTANLAPLCRTHHRFKTHAGWTYIPLQPGVYRWTSPSGQVYLRQGQGTRPSAA